MTARQPRPISGPIVPALNPGPAQGGVAGQPLVEQWFAELAQKKLKRGGHRSVQALEREIRGWFADWNDNPRPFVWTKTADEILDKVATYCRRISDSDHQ
ncbi:hypothetical protein ABZ178_40560, partial [Streptomyces massasporeus]